MGKLLKGLLGGAVAVVVLIIAAVAALVLLVDPNSYKRELEQAAREQAGIELNILGDIGWSIYPRLGLSVTEIQAHFTDRDPLAKLAQATVAVQIQPLLSGKVQMSAITIDGLELNLTRNKSGQVNWQGQPQPTTTQPADTSPRSQGLPVEIDIESITLTDGQVTYQDEQSGQRLTVSDLQLSTGRIQNNQLIPITLAMQIRQPGSQPLTIDLQTQSELQFDLAAQSYQLHGFNANTALSGAHNMTVQTAFDLTADLANGTVKINPLTITLGQLKAQGQIALTDLENMTLTGELAVAPFALNPVLEHLDQDTIKTAGNTLQKISLKAHIDGNAQRINAQDITFAIDNTTLKGTAGFALESGRLFADLHGDSINITDYLPPQAKPKQPTTNNQPAPKNERYPKAEIIPLAPLQTLNMEIKLKLAQLQYDNLHLKQVDVAVDAANGRVNIPRLNAQIFGGQVSNRITLDARKKPLKIHHIKTVKNLDLAAMLNTLTGDAPITGALDVSSDLHMQGQSIYRFVNTVTGRANVGLRNGVVKGIDMAQQMCQTMNNLTALGSLKTAKTVDASTPFAKMGGRFNIRNGVISNKDLKVSLDAIEANGRGSIDLPQTLIDYRLGLLIQENLFKKSCSVNNKIQGIEWPVNCKGSFDTEPTQLCKPDLSVIKKIVRKAAKDKAKAKLKTKLEDKLKDNDKVKGLLKGLLK